MNTHADAVSVYRGTVCGFCRCSKPPNSTFDMECYNRLPVIIQVELCHQNPNRRYSAMIRAYETLRYKNLAIQQARRRFSHGSRTH